jgi:predicted small secreted protein
MIELYVVCVYLFPNSQSPLTIAFVVQRSADTAIHGEAANSGDITMNRTIAQRLCVWLIALLGCLWVANMTACNTVKGAGEDVQSAGEGIEGAAQGADNADTHHP